jgi:hypothetical protein
MKGWAIDCLPRHGRRDFLRLAGLPLQKLATCGGLFHEDNDMRLAYKLWESLLYMPICRAYARHIIGDKPADSLYRALCGLQFRRTHGFAPNFVHPRRFTEKLWHRMLHDRDPQLTLLCDKLRVRDYVAQKAGTACLVPLLWSGESPEQIPFDTLPARYVIKTNHGCDKNIFVRDRAKIDHHQIRRTLSKWLEYNYCEEFLIGLEWGYKHIKPAIIIEELLDQDGHVPVDFKFYCFGGRVEFLTQHFGRFVKHKTRSFDRNYAPHEFRYQFEQYDGACERPKNFEAMVQLAETLAQGFDFIRVDLYNINGRILFSEMTPYPGGVSTQFLPESLDYALGTKWAIRQKD